MNDIYRYHLYARNTASRQRSEVQNDSFQVTEHNDQDQYNTESIIISALTKPVPCQNGITGCTNSLLQQSPKRHHWGTEANLRYWPVT